MVPPPETTVVLYPGIGMTHLPPMLELAELLHHHGLSVTVLLQFLDSGPLGPPPSLPHLASSHPSISFHHLPSPPISATTPEALLFDVPNHSAPLVRQALESISQSQPITALILDFFCYAAIHAAKELHIPAYPFFPTCASAVVILLHLPDLDSKLTQSLKDLGDSTLSFPGLPPIPASAMGTLVLDRDGGGYNNFLELANRLSKADGVIVNTFEALEPRAVRAIVDGLCIGNPLPLYCVGPLVVKGGGEEEKHGCLDWLEKQPTASVVFLCFGSLGRFRNDQLKEIAEGLERSGHRFLWVVRGEEPEVVLPEGFIERTKERGMVVMEGWAPQRAVLRSEAVGGFVSHCGWNSVLEAVVAGVPLVAWPLYAEQKMNRVFLVEEMKLAVAMKKSTGDGLVEAEEIESRIRWLMESKEGRELRERAAAAKENAKAAVEVGGSSQGAAERMVAVMTSGLSD